VGTNRRVEVGRRGQLRCNNRQRKAHFQRNSSTLGELLAARAKIQELEIFGASAGMLPSMGLFRTPTNHRYVLPSLIGGVEAKCQRGVLNIEALNSLIK
jgi:hypothetical protein